MARYVLSPTKFPWMGGGRMKSVPFFLRLPSTPCQNDNDKRCYTSQAMPIHLRHNRSLSEKLEYGILGHGSHQVMTPSGSVYHPFGRQAEANALSPQQTPGMFPAGSDKLNNYSHSWQTNGIRQRQLITIETKV